MKYGEEKKIPYITSAEKMYNAEGDTLP